MNRSTVIARWCIVSFLVGILLILAIAAAAWKSPQIEARKNGYAVLENRWQGWVRIKNRTQRTRYLSCKLRVFDEDHNLLGQGWTYPKRVRPSKWRTSDLIVERRNIDQRFDHWRIRRCAIVSTN